MDIFGLKIKNKNSFKQDAINEAYKIIESNNFNPKVDFFSFLGNLFQKGFYINFNSNNWISNAYEKCSPLSTIIGRVSKAMCNGIWWIVDENDTDVSELYPDIKHILKTPNPFQTWTEFFLQVDIYRQLYGESFIYYPSIPGINNRMIFCLCPSNVSIDINRDIDIIQLSKSNINYIYDSSFFKRKKIDSEEILHVRDNFQNITEYTGCFKNYSRVNSLKFEIKNIVQAQEAIYSLNKDRGAQGILSNDGRDADGTSILTPGEKNRIEEKFKRKYGLSTNDEKVLVTQFALKWQQMSFNVKDLMLFEGIRENIANIADSFDYPFELLANDKGTTFNNKSEAKKILYQDNIIPMSIIYSELFTNFFKLKEGHKIIIDFSHIECLQKAELDRNNATLKLNQAQKIAYESGIISMEEWRESLGLDRKINGNTMYEKN